MIEDIEKELLTKISTGNAILFTGAGFSLDLISLNGKHPLRASDLSKEICKIAEIESDDDLKYSSDVCIAKKHTIELINLLKDYYSIQSVGDEKSDTDLICSVKWRRFYTTNYDRGLEIGLTNNQKKYQSIGIDSDVSKYIKLENPVIHLNGFIENLSEESLNTSFKLSNSSYVDSDLSDSPNWRYFFNQDLDKCSALVFVGYSLYDMDIEKLLHENDKLRNKTYFITEKNVSPKNQFRFEKYGKILPIEKHGFAELIQNNASSFSTSPKVMKGFISYSEDVLKEDIHDSDIQSFLLYGKNQESLAASILLNVNSKQHFAVYRKKLISDVMTRISDNRHVLLLSNYGNGKTCLLWQIATELFQQAKEVYFLSDSNIDYFEELKKFSQSSEKVKYVIVDDCMSKKDFFKNFAFLQPANVLLVCADRTEVIKKWYSDIFQEEVFDFASIPIDNLSDFEFLSFNDILDFIGLWGSLAGTSIDTKKRFFEDDNNHIQFSNVLLKLLKSPVITDKINELCKAFLTEEKYQDFVIAVCYLRIIGIKPYFNLVYELSDSDLIYSPLLSKNEKFSQLFTLRDDYVEISDVFAKYFMSSNLISGEKIIERLYFIVKKFNNYADRDYFQNAIFRSALRFHVVSSLLPEENRKGMLLDYYEQLKTILPWLKNDPNYWMQYGMAKMMWSKLYDDAQKLLETAYSVAEHKSEYNVFKIDNQQARLYLLTAQLKTVESDKFLYFQKADSILKHVEMDSYALHRIEDMLAFYDKCFTMLSIKNRKNVLSSFRFYQEKIQNYTGDDKHRFSNLYTIIEQKITQLLDENDL